MLEFGSLIHNGWTSGLRSQVAVYGPVGIVHIWAHFLEMMTVDIETRLIEMKAVLICAI